MPAIRTRSRAASEPLLPSQNPAERVQRGETTPIMRVLRGMKELLSMCLDELEFEDCLNFCIAIGSLRAGESATSWLLYTYITSHRLKMRNNPKYMELDNLPVWRPAKAKFESKCFGPPIRLDV